MKFYLLGFWRGPNGVESDGLNSESMLRILTVVGARPQFIKAAAVSRAIAESTEVEESILHTGQHYDDAMSDQFFRELEIPRPAVNLEVGSNSHGAQTGQMLEAIEKEIVSRKPDWLLVYGDTNSTVAGSLAAVKLHVPVAHVEAGLRSFNRRMPEEINRIVTDHVSDVLYAPTDVAVKNLADEGISGEKVVQVGDVMYDVAIHAAQKAQRESGILAQEDLEPKRFVLATIHRADNTDDPEVLREIVDGLLDVAAHVRVVFPVHPRTRAALEKSGLWDRANNGLRLIDPVGYYDMVLLEKYALVVATDSGGVQKEAYFHGTPCVTLRTETEWVELLDLGWNRVQPPTSARAIAGAIQSAASSHGAEGQPYGDGRAAHHIVENLKAGKLALVP